MLNVSTQGIGRSENLTAIFPAVKKPLVALAYVDKQVDIWDLQSETKIWSFKPPLARFETMAWDARARRLAIGDRLGKIAIYSIDTGTLEAELPAQPSAVWSLAFSPDDKKLVAGRDDGRIAVWDFASKKWDFEATAHSARVNSIAFVPAGDRFVTAASDGMIQFWMTDHFRPIALLPWFAQATTSRTHVISSAKFDPSGTYLAAWNDDGILKIWRRPPP